MPRGGAREGAGRKARFSRRTSIPVYMEKSDLHALNSFVEFYKQLKGEATISTSSVLAELGQIWLADLLAEHEDQYEKWAVENMAMIEANYASEAKRLKKKGKKVSGQPD